MAMSSARNFMDEARPGVPVKKADLTVDGPPPPVAVSFAQPFDDDETNVQPERFLMDQMRMRPRANSHHLRSTNIPSRRLLTWKARGWRAGMSLGMVFHGWHRIKAPGVSFKRKIHTDTIPIELCFYLPQDYKKRIKEQPDYRYSIVVNFHGGGFVLGSPTDDRYWARIVLEKTPCVFMSVGYRRAPEHPFPSPVDDCVEALLYLQTHADELHIDPSRVVLSGFSAGANLAFTVPFRLTYQYEQPDSDNEEDLPVRVNASNFVPDPQPAVSPQGQIGKRRDSPLTNKHIQILDPGKNDSQASTLHSTRRPMTRTPTNTSQTNLLNIPGPRSKLLRTITQDSNLVTFKNNLKNRSTTSLKPNPTLSSHDELTPIATQVSSTSSSSFTTPRLRIISIIAWYPLLDWTSSRAAKIRHSRNPHKTLPRAFTDLFDFSYLPAPDLEGHHCSPYASPSLAPPHMIRAGLPNPIQIWLCEWDMLLAEGEKFAENLKTQGKDVFVEMIPGVPHGFDKSPSPFRDQHAIDGLYCRAAERLNDTLKTIDRRGTVGEGIGLGGLI